MYYSDPAERSHLIGAPILPAAEPAAITTRSGELRCEVMASDIQYIEDHTYIL